MLQTAPPPALPFVHTLDAIDPHAPALVLILAATPAQPASQLLRAALARFLPADPAAIHLDRDVHGRPFLRNHPLSLSISHTAPPDPPVLALALARQGRIGVDLEFIHPTLDFAPIARDHFTPSENAWLAHLPPTDRPAAFTRLWTAKEASLKALGLGLTVSMSDIELQPEPHFAIRRLAHSTALAAGWRIVEHAITIAGRNLQTSTVLGNVL